MTNEADKRWMRDEVILDEYNYPNKPTALRDILKGIPLDQWPDVLFFYDTEGDYYGGTIVTSRFYTQRPETDAEYESRMRARR